MKNESENDPTSSNSLDNKSKRAYSLLEDIRNQMKRSQRLIMFLSIFLIIAVFIIVFSYISTDTTAQKAGNETDENKALIELRSQNKALLEKINALEQANAELNKMIYDIEDEVLTERTDDPYMVTEGSDLTSNPTEHIVKEGETLWEIAQKYLGDGNKYPDLAKKNQLENADFLKAGEVLTIKN